MSGSRAEDIVEKNRSREVASREICIPHDRHVQRVSMASVAAAWMAPGALYLSSATKKWPSEKKYLPFPAHNNREPNKNKSVDRSHAKEDHLLEGLFCTPEENLHCRS
jgi:hypothetical protein